MGAGGGGGGGADLGVKSGAGGLDGVAAGGGGGATGNGGGAAPVKSRAAKAGGSCFVAAATTFSFPIVCWAAMSVVRFSGSQQFVPSLILVCLHTTPCSSACTIIGRTLHKEDVYATSI